MVHMVIHRAVLIQICLQLKCMNYCLILKAFLSRYIAISTLYSSAYDVVVHWRRNLFLVPFGMVGKAFVQELARLFTAYGEGGTLECIAIKAAMVMCSLLLQKPHQSAKTQDFIASLECRLVLWGKGEIQELLREGQVIQWCLATGRAHTNDFKVEDISRHYASQYVAW